MPSSLLWTRSQWATPRQKAKRPHTHTQRHPRAPRQRTLIRAVMHAPGLPGHEVIVRDVSERGMRVASRGITAHVGETLGIILPGDIEVQARVCWVKGEEFGAELFEELDLRRLGLTNQRRHARSAGDVIHWLINERLQTPVAQPFHTRLRCC
ncbi:MAG: PilZ domain-containing protein [Novosphingobium sp.]